MTLGFTCKIRMPSAGLDSCLVAFDVDSTSLLKDLILRQGIQGRRIFDISRSKIEARYSRVRPSA